MYNIVTKNNDHLIDLQLNILFLFKKNPSAFFYLTYWRILFYLTVISENK